MAGERVWKRIEIEFSAGATAEWLSVKYGPAVRTIGARAKKGAWRKRDIALKADATWDAVEDEARLTEETRAAVREAADRAATRRAAVKAAIREAGQGAGDSGDVPEVDLGRAVRAAQAKAVAAMENGEPKAAQEFLKLARMLEGEDGAETGIGGPSAQDEAALAAILEKLGELGEAGV
ncbi:hypothetical protein [Brevundimonas sp.]|uniref:hypothetical protein n=1 Tax=Brevundimonas sp. TaxID=1871086 RepID=UPI003D1366A1